MAVFAGGRLGRVPAAGGMIFVLLLSVVTATAHARPVGPHPQLGDLGRALAPDTRLFVPPPDRGAVEQEHALLWAGDRAGASLLAGMESTSHAVWFDGGTPQQVRRQARQVMAEAARQHAVPVLVAYDIPGRDCSQYSAGGALNLSDYEAWIGALAQGIGRRQAVVLLEPDSLGLLPSSCGGPSSSYPFTDSDRYAELNYAVDTLERDPGTSVYLDGTHSAWLAVGDIAQRLATAGVQRAQGFFVNVSNYQPTPELIDYGTWISDCIAFANDPEQGGWRLGHYDYCASQYYPATQSDFSTWEQTTSWYRENMGSAVATTHFVIDTSRNGQGPNDMEAYAKPPYNQPPAVISALQAGNWCNPPGRGLGLRPTAATGVPLLDAYLWVKVPGESDGQCDLAGGARDWDYSAYTQPGWPTAPAQQALFDPLWGLFDPPAGAWFPQQALQLAENANPPLAVSAAGHPPRGRRHLR
jgi:endoglucanase